MAELKMTDLQSEVWRDEFCEWRREGNRKDADVDSAEEPQAALSDEFK
jgi:hypothetical protein